MRVSSLARIAVITAAVGSVTILANAAPASAASCRSTVTATGSTNIIQYLASVSSKYAWKSKVSSRYGASYDTWGNAKNKGVSCKKAGPNKFWQCTASGRPCN